MNLIELNRLCVKYALGGWNGAVLETRCKQAPTARTMVPPSTNPLVWYLTNCTSPFPIVGFFLFRRTTRLLERLSRNKPQCRESAQPISFDNFDFDFNKEDESQLGPICATELFLTRP